MDDPTLSFINVDRSDIFGMISEEFEAGLTTAEERSMSLEEKVRLAQELQNQAIEGSHTQNLLTACTDTVVKQMIGTFGLGPFFHQDKDGGNVTTIHNADKGVFAKGEDERRYTQEFNRDNYDMDFNKMKKGIYQKNPVIYDEYTGKELYKDGRTSVDHVVSAKEIHSSKKMRLYLSDEKRKAVALNKKNLALIDVKMNKSKGEHKLKFWAAKQSTDKDSKTNAEKYEVDMDKASAREKIARDYVEGEERDSAVDYYKKHLKETGINEGLRLGTRQAIGLILYEFSAALFEEFKEYIKNFKKYRQEKTVMKEFSAVIKRVAARVLKKRKDVAGAFAKGFISGFMSNLVTVLINCFFTTTKQIVRIIREGFASFVRAIKMLLFPPVNMTRQKATLEASKVLAFGLVTCGGIVMEEAFRTYLLTLPPLIPFAEIISGTVVGLLTGILATTIVYFIDQIGIGGYESTDVLEARTGQLEARTELLRGQLQVASAGIDDYENADDYFKKNKKADQNTKDLIDFFEE